MALTPKKVDKLIALAKESINRGRLAEAEAYVDSKLMRYAQSGIQSDAVTIDLWVKFNKKDGNPLNAATVSALINLYTNAGWNVVVDDGTLILAKRPVLDAKLKIRRVPATSPSDFSTASAKPW